LSIELKKKIFNFYQLSKSSKIADNGVMKGVTVSEMAEKTGLKPKTILTRLRTLGIKPITKEAIYDPSALIALEEMRPVGRPPKNPPEPPVSRPFS
jgi:hypothetical protein